MPFDASIVAKVVAHLEAHPEDIHDASFSGLKAWCEKFGRAKFVISGGNKSSPTGNKPHADPFEINPDEDPDPERWPDVAEDDYQPVTATANSEDEAKLDEANDKKAAAADAASNGDLAGAIKLMTQALSVKPESAMWWAYRADLYAKKKSPKSALKDANRAIELNPESARALRVKGTALRHLGKWEEAADALNHANQCDFDESSVELAKICTERANKIRQNRWRKEQQEAEQKELDQLRAEARAKAAREQAAAAEVEEEDDETPSMPPPRGGGGMPGGFPGGMPAGMPPGMADLFNDPEMAAMMQDPDVAAKLSTLMSNPMAAMQYMSDPKIGPLLQKLMSKMMGGGMGGMPGGMPGGMGGGMPGGFPGGMPGMPGGRPGGMGGMFGGGGAGKSAPQRPPQQQQQQAPPKPAAPSTHADDLD